MTNNQEFTTDLPRIEESIYENHPKRFFNKKLVANSLFLMPLLIGAISTFFYAPIEWSLTSIGAWLVLAGFSFYASYKAFPLRGFALREEDITYRHGWIFQHQITVAFNRIQHTEISHGPIDRMFNLSKLEIYTAGGSSSDLAISGLDPQVAANMKEFISKKTAQYV